MKKNIEKNVALTIVRAKACSDAGKNIYFLNLQDFTSDALVGKKYEAKDEQILKAIHIICRISCERAGAKFDVIKDPAGIANYICYFTYYLNNQKRQISFHTYSRKIGRFCRNDSKVRWDHKDSRQNSKELIKFFGF